MFVKSLFLYVCALVDVKVPRNTHGGHRTACKGLLSSSAMWGPGDGTQIFWLGGKLSLSLSLNWPRFSKLCPATLKLSRAETVEYDLQ